MTVSIGQTKLEDLAFCPLCHAKTVVADYYLEEQGSYTIRCHCESCDSDFPRNYFTFEESLEAMRLYGPDDFYQGPTRAAEDDMYADLKRLAEIEELFWPL